MPCTTFVPPAFNPCMSLHWLAIEGSQLTMKGPRRVGVAVLAATVVTSTVACSSQAPTEAPTEAPTGAVTRATFSYTCCTAADIDRVYHPGDVLSIHWIVQKGTPTSATQPTHVNLSVRLTGPYADVSSAQRARGEGHLVDLGHAHRDFRLGWRRTDLTSGHTRQRIARVLRPVDWNQVGRDDRRGRKHRARRRTRPHLIG